MHEKMRALLNAYLDGELPLTTTREVEQHLANCNTCRRELDELHRVSRLLKTDPSPEFIPVERFVNNLALSLPRQELREKKASSASLAWWLVPTGLILAWFFVRTAFTLSGLLSLADSTGLLGQASNWIGGQQVAFWFPAAANIFAGYSSGTYATLSLVNSLDVLGTNLLTGFLLQAIIAVMYATWLALWWFFQQQKNRSMNMISIRS